MLGKLKKVKIKKRSHAILSNLAGNALLILGANQTME
jgi:hypothetical protein